MTTFFITLESFLLLLSISLNIFLGLKMRKKPRREPSMDLQEFFRKVMSAGALVAFGSDGQAKVLDEELYSLQLKSPKQK